MVDYPCPYRNCQFMAGESAILGQIHIMYCWLYPPIYIRYVYMYIYIICIHIYNICIYITYIITRIYILYIYIYPFIIHPLIVGWNIICVDMQQDRLDSKNVSEAPRGAFEHCPFLRSFPGFPIDALHSCRVTPKWKPKLAKEDVIGNPSKSRICRWFTCWIGRLIMNYLCFSSISETEDRPELRKLAVPPILGHSSTNNYQLVMTNTFPWKNPPIFKR